MKKLEPSKIDPAYSLRIPAKTGANVRTGHCDTQVAYKLPAQRFDQTAQALAHASGCFIEDKDQTLAAVSVKAVKGRMTLR